jgi:hypothetical protein
MRELSTTADPKQNGTIILVHNQPIREEKRSGSSRFEVVESNWPVQVASRKGVDPKQQTALRFTLSTSFVTKTIC